MIAERTAGAAGAAGAAGVAAQPRLHAAVQNWWDGLADIRVSDFENLQPPVVVPVVALEVSDVSNNDIIAYPRFWRNDMCCAVHDLSKQAKLENTRLEQSTVPVSFLGDSSTTDVLGLMHERTGHQNKRSLIECVKSRLVTGLEIEEKHIRKYKQDDRHVCDICAQAKLTRTIFKKFHTIRGKELGDYISVDIAVFVNCESCEGCKYVVYFVDECIAKLRHLVDVELVSHGKKIKH